MSVHKRSMVLGIVICFASEAAFAILPPTRPILKSFDFQASNFVVDPTKPLLYAISYYDHQLAVIDTNSLSLVNTIPLSLGPTGLDFSPDGSKLYVSCQSNDVDVIDTTTLNVSHIPLDFAPFGVATGYDGQLWLESEYNFIDGQYYRDFFVHRIDPTNGTETGNFRFWTYYGNWKMSPDRRTLYYGDAGLSPASMKAIDISAPAPGLEWESPFGTLGSNGQDIVISHNGKFLAYLTGTGNELGHARHRTI